METDEFERSIVIEFQPWGIGRHPHHHALWGFLEIFLSVAHLPVGYSICVGTATPFIRLRYR